MTNFTDIDNAYRKITARANMLYEFVILYHNYIYGKHTYEAENCNMMQIHTLTFIDDCPGITATQLSKIWHKSKSAISQTTKKLIESGYVEKRYMENNEKTARLYVTEKGNGFPVFTKHMILQILHKLQPILSNNAARLI